MRIIYSLVLVVALSLAMTACKKVSSRQDLEKIQALEAQAKENHAKGGKDKTDHDQLVQLGEAYDKFATTYPDAPETPEFLFRAGELYSNELQDFPKAIEMFKRNHERYPEHETAGNALFFVAYLYNNSVHDLLKAEQYYKEFLEKYPTHKMAESARFELEVLGIPVDSVFEKLIADDSTQTPAPAAP